MKGLRYGIIGTGAIGGYYGAMLARSGKEVHFLFHSDYDFVKANGLQVDSPKGSFHLDGIHAWHAAQDMPQCDVVFVCLKTTKNNLLNQLLPPLLKADTRVVLIQNGIGVEAGVQAMFPGVKLAAGIAYVCIGKTGPGHIDHQDLGLLQLAPYGRPADDPVLQQVADDLQAVGIPSKLIGYQGARWRKCVWNIPFNGLTVVLRTTTKDIVSDPAACSLVRRIIHEVVEAANACGGRIAHTVADETVEMTRKMIPYSPSMKLDFDHRRPMEIQYLYSNAISEAEAHGVAMPLTRMLEQELRFIQDGYLK